MQRWELAATGTFSYVGSRRERGEYTETAELAAMGRIINVSIKPVHQSFKRRLIATRGIHQTGSFVPLRLGGNLSSVVEKIVRPHPRNNTYVYFER